MPKLVLVRHGESQWNKENRFTGWIDIPLSDKGREEALAAGRHLKSFLFERAYTSKLERAQETLKIILDAINQSHLETVEDQALNERHYGDLQGLNKAETAKKFGEEQVRIWRRSYDVAPPNGESLKDTAARTLPFFRSHILKDIRAGKNILVSAHGNSLRAIVMELDGLSGEEVARLEIPTGVPIVYTYGNKSRPVSKQILK